MAGRSRPSGTHRLVGVARLPDSARTSWAAARLSVYWAALKAIRCGARPRRIPHVITAMPCRAAAIGRPAYSRDANEKVVEGVAPLFSVEAGAVIGRSSRETMMHAREQKAGELARARRSGRPSHD